MIRELIARFNKSMDERVASVRHKREVPIRLSFAPNGQTGKLEMAAKIVFVAGETTDLSSSGIAFIVASIRVKENYLVGENRILNAELDLPNGKVSMKIVGQRYEQVGEHISTARYLVGASIKEMTAENRAAYDHFLRSSDNKINPNRLTFGTEDGKYL